MKKNVDRSTKLKRAVRAKPKQCFANAWDAIETQEEYKHATYVEGMAVDGQLVFEHGWVEHEGEIIDPTLPGADMAYFPGLRFKGSRIARLEPHGPEVHRRRIEDEGPQAILGLRNRRERRPRR